MGFRYEAKENSSSVLHKGVPGEAKQLVPGYGNLPSARF